MTELKKGDYYSKRMICKELKCSPSWLYMILERPEFFKFRKLAKTHYAKDPLYMYLFCDELVDCLKKLYRPRGNKYKKNLL